MFRAKTQRGPPSARRMIKRSRSGSPLTHSVEHLAKQLVNRKLMHPSILKNLEIILGFRDSATHFINSSTDFHRRLYEIGAACVKNFANAVRDWFNRDVKEFGQYLMPLTFVDLSESQIVSLQNTEEKTFVAFMNSVDHGDQDLASPYSISIDVEVRFLRSMSQDAMKVQVTDDPSALPVKVTEEDIRRKYPWDYKTLTDKCRARYRDFKVDARYHCIRKRLESDSRYGHPRFLDPGNPRSQKKPFFSPNIVKEFDGEYRRR